MTEIEVKLAHLEDAVTQLSDVVYSQQNTLERLELAFRQLRERIESAGDVTGRAHGDERPPHY